MLKRLKSIEDKTDNQLDLIKDQGDRQLDRINSNLVTIKSVGFQDERLKDLKKEIDDKEKLIIKAGKSKNKEERKKAAFVYTATDGTPFDFSDYKHLIRFAEEVYNKELSFNEAKDEQKEMLKKIKELKKRVNPLSGSRPKKKQTKIKWKM